MDEALLEFLCLSAIDADGVSMPIDEMDEQSVKAVVAFYLEIV